jgi:hypothetical protein
MSGAQLAIIAGLDVDEHKQTRATPLRRAGVSAARKILMGQLAEAGIKLLNPTIITEAILRAYVDADELGVIAQQGRWSETTRRLATMQVGETITVKSTRATAHQRLKPARLLMNNPAAAWTMMVEGVTVHVTRLPDGAEHAPRQWSKIVERLAAMNVGQRLVIKEIRASQDGYFRLASYYPGAARRRMNDPDASWTSESTTKGCRVERIR